MIRITSCEHRRVVRLAAGGVRLAQQLLQQEAKPLPHAVGRRRRERRAKRGEVRVKAADLLADVEPVGEDRDLLREALLVERDALGQLAIVRAQAVALLDESLRRALVDSIDRLLDDRQVARSRYVASRAPSPLRICIERRNGAFDDRDELGRRARRPRSSVDAMTSGIRSTAPTSIVSTRPKRCLQLREAARRTRAKRCSSIARRPASGRSTRAKSVTCPRATPLRSASRTSPSHLLELARKLDRRIEESVIDGANLDGDPRAANVALRRPESRHAFYHIAGA